MGSSEIDLRLRQETEIRAFLIISYRLVHEGTTSKHYHVNDLARLQYAAFIMPKDFKSVYTVVH